MDAERPERGNETVAQGKAPSDALGFSGTILVSALKAAQPLYELTLQRTPPPTSQPPL